MTEVVERPTGPRAAARVIASRNFGPYFAGNALSASGVWFQNLGGALLVYRLTHSAFLLGVLNFAQFIPMLVLVPWTGSAADRFDRRRLILWSQLAATALSGALAALAWAGLASTAAVILVSLALGVTSAVAAPASQALVASLVEPDDVPTAVGLNSMTYNVARALGPTLAAAAIATLGIPAAFAVNSASYLLLVLGVAVVHPRPQRTASRVESRLRDSLRLVRREPRLAAFLAIVAVVGFASDPINTLAPAFARAFARPDTDAGFIIGAFGAGAVTAALLLAGRITGSPSRLAATLAVLGVGVPLFALCPWLPLAIVPLFVAGFGYLASNTAATSRLQLEVDELQRGRIMALWTVAFLGLRPFASLADGAIASAAGVRTAGVVLALPALVAAGAVALLVRGGKARRSPRAAASPSGSRRA